MVWQGIGGAVASYINCIRVSRLAATSGGGTGAKRATGAEEEMRPPKRASYLSQAI